jgi:hypothetical protein
MSVENTYRVTVEADQEGQLFKLPEGWLIDPENSDVIIEHEIENGRYIVRPVFDEDGQPNCKFIFPATEAG